MTEGFEVTRELDLDLSAEELWELVSNGDAWSEWLADTSTVEVAPGQGGRVVDDGEEREVAVERVDRAAGVRFAWWPSAAPDERSVVELVVVELPDGGSRLRINETFSLTVSGLVGAADAAIRWDVRALPLWLRRLLRVGV